MRENKLVILGAGGVGKTSLVMQFLEGFFSCSYKPTVEDYYRHTLQLPNGIFHTVEILDTSGSHHFPAMRELSIRSSRAFVLVFSVDNEQSFYEVMAIWELIMKIKGKPDIPVILVGNKVDLEENRKVPREVAFSFSKESMHCCRYLETSAKYNVNVGQLFSELLMKTFYGDELKRENAAAENSSRRPSRRLSRRLSSLSLRRKSCSPCAIKSVATDGHILPKESTPATHDYRSRCVIL